MATFGTVHHRAYHNDSKYSTVALYLIGAFLIAASIAVAASKTTMVEGGVSKAQAVVFALR